MKREYKKPMIAVESFQLNATIAGSCNDQGLITLGHGQNNCSPVEETGGAVAMMGMACEEQVEECYQGPIFTQFMES